jgi:release factor glutamine methyltransferase
MPTVKELLAEGRARLAVAGVAAPALDARLLLQHAARLTTADLVAHPDMTVSAPAAVAFLTLLERRELREPVSKIIGIKEFFGREFEVSSAVLDPRPDSESLIELCLAIIDTHEARQILDLGTGSGNLLLTLLAERRHLTGLGVDLSQEALKVALRNAAALGLSSRADFMWGRWFEPVAERFDLIVSNPPYIETAAIDSLQPEVRFFDPRKALDGGTDGLDCYRAIAGEAASFLAPGGHVAVEIGDGQDAAVTQVFSKNGFESAGKRLDLSGKPRALAFRPI